MILFQSILVILIFVCLINFFNHLLFYIKSKVIKGKIIDKVKLDDGDHVYLLPIVEYFDEDVQKYYTFLSKVGFDKQDKIGQIVEVRLYKSTKKRKCEINSLLRIFFIEIIVAIPTLLVLLLTFRP